MARTAVWSRAEHALTRATPRSIVLLTDRRAPVAILDGPALVVWEELESPASDAELIARVAERSGQSPAEVEPTVTATRAMLVQLGAITGSS